MYWKNAASSLLILSLVVCPLSLAHAAAVNDADGVLHRAYYVEHETEDYAQARKLYEDALANGIRGEARRAAQAGAARCRDQLVARNFARLMPPDALGYVEVKRPGEIIEKLAGMLGLTSKSIPEVLAARPDSGSGDFIHVPSEFVISPSVFEALGSFGGLAFAVTSVDFEREAPSGLMVLHHGDVAMLKGLLETCFQFSPTAEKIHGLPTFGAAIPEVGQITGVLTESLFIVGTGRSLTEGAVSRLLGKSNESLATRSDLKKAVAASDGATFFAYANLQEIIKLVRRNLPEHEQHDLAIADAIVDLKSLRWATFSMGIKDGVLGAQASVRLADDHRSIAYNLMRLPPMSKKCLKNVPPNAAGLVGIGLNPAIAQVAASAGEHATVTGFDIGRELFGNIQEICAFAIPGDMVEAGKGHDRIPLPNIGVLMAVNDIAKSRALWDQILTLPGLVAGDEPVKPRELKIGKSKATVYTIPEMGKVYVTELDGCIAVGLTRSVLKASIRAHGKQKSILEDEVMGKVLAQMPEDSSIMFAAHVGGLMEVYASSEQIGAGMAMQAPADLCRNMVAWCGLGQSPNEMTVRVAVTGLPDLNEALKKYGSMMGGMANMAMRAEQSRSTVVRMEHPAHTPQPAPKKQKKKSDPL